MNPKARSRYRQLLRACFLALPVSLVFPLAQNASAADGTWTNFSSGNWNVTGSWSGGTVADGANFTADFSTLNISNDLTVTLNSSRTIGNLFFGDVSTVSNDWILAQSGGSILTLQTSTGTPTIKVNNRTATISLELAGNNGMTKEGAGTLVLTGVNSYTGTTTVNGGTLTLGSGGSLTSSSALAVGGNGMFSFSGAAAASQTVAGLTVNQGFGTVNNTVAGTTLNLGAITHNAGGMVYFGNTTGTITTTTTNTNGIIGPWAFVGAGTTLDYAVANGSGSTLSSLGAATTLPTSGPGVSTTNYTLAGAQTQTANTVGNTLRYTGAANTLALGTTSLGLSGLMNAGTGLLTISGTAGNAGLVTTGELDIVTNTGGITISSVISGTGSVVVGGVGTTVAVSATLATGLVTLSGDNTYSGGTVINSGALRAATSTALGTGAVTVTNGAQLQLQGGVTIANTININGSGALFSTTSSGTPNLSGTVNLLGNSSIGLATNSGNAAMTLSGILNLNGNILSAGTININPAVTISAVINGAGGITNTGNGVLVISNDNSGTYSGTTTISANGGTLQVGSDGALGSGTLSLNATSATLTVRSADATTRTLSNALILGGNTSTTYTFGAATTYTGNLAFTNTTSIALSTLRTFQVLNSQTQFDAAFTGAGGITKTGAGTLILDGASTYAGATAINAGTLQLGNGGTTGSLATGSAISVGTGANFAIKRSNAVAQGTDFSSAAITGLGSFTQAGAGTTTLSAINTYSGATTISAGTLTIASTGTINGSSGVSIGAGEFNYNSSTALSAPLSFTSTGGKLSGTGTISSAVTVSAGNTLAPGNGPGVMTFGNTLMLAGAVAMDANGTVRGTGYDGVNTSGLLTYGGTLTVNFGSTFLAGGETFDLFSISGGSSGDFSSVSITGSYVASLTNNAGVWTGSAGGYDFTFTQSTGDLLVAASAVPEPSTYAMIAGATLMGFTVLRRRRQTVSV